MALLVPQAEVKAIVLGGERLEIFASPDGIEDVAGRTRSEAEEDGGGELGIETSTGGVDFFPIGFLFVNRRGGAEEKEGAELRRRDRRRTRLEKAVTFSLF